MWQREKEKKRERERDDDAEKLFFDQSCRKMCAKKKNNTGFI